MARSGVEAVETVAGAKAGPLEVDSRGRGSDGDPRYHVLLGDVLPGTSGVIADTLNSDHLFTEEEGRAWLEKLAHRYNVHDDMLAALEAAEEAESVKDELFAWITASERAKYLRRSALSKAKGSV